MGFSFGGGVRWLCLGLGLSFQIVAFDLLRQGRVVLVGLVVNHAKPIQNRLLRPLQSVDLFADVGRKFLPFAIYAPCQFWNLLRPSAIKNGSILQ